MTIRRQTNGDALDESLRRLGGILGSPSLALSYGRTTPLLERARLRRAGLSRAEADAFLALMCRHGQLDAGVEAVVSSVCQSRRIAPAEAVRLLLSGAGWPGDEEDV